MFVVIEGDNGTGKTTVSHILNSQYGFEFITEHQQILELEQQAKRFATGSAERFEAFLDYNSVCGRQAKKYDKALLARYWISTVSAAYADGLLDINETLEKADMLMETMVIPDFVFRLRCDFDKRIERIDKRAAVNGNDDRTAERDRRYSFILDCLQGKTGIITEISTDNISPADVAGNILNYIGEAI